MWRKLRSLVQSKSDNGLTPLSFETFADYPLFLMVEGRPPFLNWRPPQAEIEPALSDFMMHCVNLFQMFVWYSLVGQKYGYDIADRALAYQKRRLGRASAELSDGLESGVLMIRDLAIQLADPEAIQTSNGPWVPPFEFGLALKLLCAGEGAPFPPSSSGDLPPLRDQDIALSICLIHGKETAREHFEAVIERTSVTL